MKTIGALVIGSRSVELTDTLKWESDSPGWAEAAERIAPARLARPQDGNPPVVMLRRLQKALGGRAIMPPLHLDHVPEEG